jgi:hypothetical protein
MKQRNILSPTVPPGGPPGVEEAPYPGQGVNPFETRMNIGAFAYLHNA